MGATPGWHLERHLEIVETKKYGLSRGEKKKVIMRGMARTCNEYKNLSIHIKSYQWLALASIGYGGRVSAAPHRRSMTREEFEWSYEQSYAVHPSLYEAVKKFGRELRPISYLEIGVREGDSVAALLSVCKLAFMVLCDDWGTNYGGSGRGSHRHVADMLSALGYAGAVKWIDGKSEEFDLILVDGDHSLEGALQDFHNCWPLLRPGGVMLADDTTHPAHRYLDGAFRDFVASKDGEVVFADNDHSSGIVAAVKRVRRQSERFSIQAR
jgi:hypothetical protein